MGLSRLTYYMKTLMIMHLPDGRNFESCLNANAQSLTFPKKALNNCFRRVSDREHSSIFLHFQLNTFRSKPGDGVLWIIFFEHSAQPFFPAWIMPGELNSVVAGVCNITSPSTRHSDLREKLAGFLNN